MMDIRSDSPTSDAPQIKRTQIPTFKKYLNAFRDRERETRKTNENRNRIGNEEHRD